MPRLFRSGHNSCRSVSIKARVEARLWFEAAMERGSGGSNPLQQLGRGLFEEVRAQSEGPDFSSGARAQAAAEAFGPAEISITRGRFVLTPKRTLASRVITAARAERFARRAALSGTGACRKPRRAFGV